ncbi:MAG: sigma-70 family RNA polymerase sigma factor [Planctomycetes bacterium]|nr:sigma-70 family RNA polymerase sigma factor [Planctomycetota bacterium]
MHSPLEHELTAHAAALRRLAVRLVGADGADDLVQDAALQTLVRPPARPTGLGAWLGAVLRHRASKHSRGERRRRDREQRQPAPEPPHDPHRLAEHREMIARLHAGLLALPAVYADVLQLRYFEELTPTEIAARLGAPLATVKSRLQRGVGLLREQLGDERDWRTRLGAAFGLNLGALPLAGATLATGAIMGTAGKLACGAAAAAAALWWIFGTLTAPTVAPDGASDGGGATSVVVAAGDPVRAHERPGANPPAPVDRTAATSDAVTLHGRCVDEHGAPLAGLSIALRGHRIEGGLGKDFDGEYSDWLQRRGGFAPQDRTATTAADGTFAFACEPSPLNLTLRIARVGLEQYLHVGQELEARDRDLGDLVVPMPCRLSVRVVDERGRPVLSPPLRLQGGADFPERTFRSWPPAPAIEPGGSASLSVVAGTYTLSVASRTITAGASCTVPPTTATWTHDVVVAAGPSDETITGTVVDALQRPIAGVDIYASSGWGGQTTAVTDSLGDFTLYRPETSGDEIELRCSRDGYLPNLVRGVRYGDRDVRVQLRSAASVELTVLDADDRPVEDYGVRVWVAPGTVVNSYRNEGDLRHGGHHERGVVIVDELDVGELLLLAEPHRQDLWRSEPVRVTVATGQQNRATIRVPTAGQRQLRVESARGDAIEGAKVEVFTNDAQEGTRAPQYVDIEHWQPREPHLVPLVQRVETDSAGGALLRGPSSGTVTVRVVVDGAEHRRDQVSLTDPAPLVVRLPASGRAIAKIGPPQLVALLREVCRLPADGPSPGLADRNQPGFRLGLGAWPRFDTVLPADGSRVIAGDGTVTFDDVPPGTYQLTLEPWDWFPDQVLVWKGSNVPVATVVVTADATATVAVDLADWLPGELTGTVRCNGAPVADAEIQLENARLVPGSTRQLRTMSRVRTDAEGRFRARLRSGTVRVLAERGDRNRVDWRIWHLRSDDAVFVPAGGRVQQEFTVTACAVRLRLLDQAGEPIEGVEVRLRDDARDRARLTHRSDADGWIETELEPGAFAASVLPRGRKEPWLPLGDLTAAPGKKTEVTLRLPPQFFR